MIYHSGNGCYYPPLSNGHIYLLAKANCSPERRMHYVMQLITLFGYALYAVNRKPWEKTMPYQETTFINLKLSEKEKKAFTTWAVEQAKDVDMHLTHVILGGHKISMSYSDKNSSFSCAITCRDKASVNNGRCIVSMHKTPFDALWVALYKHVMVLGDDDWELVTGESDWG